MSLQDQMARGMLRLVRDLGQTIAFRRVPGAAYDPSTGASTAGEPQNETVQCYFARYRESQIDGTIIQAGDRRALIAALYNGTPIIKRPQIDDILIGEGREVRILSVQEYQIGTQEALYACQVRG
ncbi:MAG: hypothetical protein AAF545_15315 [Pseudomonadota bacterium]